MNILPLFHSAIALLDAVRQEPDDWQYGLAPGGGERRRPHRPSRRRRRV
jgi:hypothetical protein